MKKLIILFLLSFVLNSFAQTSIPSSGAITINQIATVMYNLGQITLAEKNGALSISFLNGKSTLSDKTAPYSLSDWYGYGASSFYTWVFDAYNASGGEAGSCTSGSPTTMYSSSSSLGLSVVLYTNTSLTTPAPNGSYRISDNRYYVSSYTVAGQITSTGSCGF
ncbi:MAG: hypothetical protein H7202_13025 [Pedobacter sp.]|nr:hypothetical protein [Pedobacter sp.]